MRNRRISHMSQIQFRAMHGVEKMEVRQPSLVDSFYFTESVCPETGEKISSYSHPIYMLFNQQRLDRMGPAAVEQWLKSLDNSGNNALSELRSKCSDDDLLQLVKSRHCQSPSELETWINSLNERADLFNREVARIVAERKEEQDRQKAVQLQQEQLAQQQSKTE